MRRRGFDALLARRGQVGKVVTSYTVQCGSRPIGTGVVLIGGPDDRRRIVAILDVVEPGGRIWSKKRDGFATTCEAGAWLERVADRIPCPGRRI